MKMHYLRTGKRLKSRLSRRVNRKKPGKTRISKVEFQLLLTMAYAHFPGENDNDSDPTEENNNDSDPPAENDNGSYSPEENNDDSDPPEENDNDLDPGNTTDPTKKIGISLWSEDGYLLDVEHIDGQPTIASGASKCCHQARRIILRNNRRTKNTTLCCSHKFFCSVCFVLMINSGVSRILFPISKFEEGTLHHTTDIFKMITEKDQTGTMEEILRLVATSNMAIAFEALGRRASILARSLSGIIKFKKAEFLEIYPQVNPATESNSKQWFYMVLCIICMFRSEDRKGVRVGSVAVRDGKLVGIGYNAYPIGVKAAGTLPACAEFVVHAEQNLLLFRTDYAAKELTLYSTRMPCNLCWPLLPDYANRFVYWEIPLQTKDGKILLKDGKPKLKYEYQHDEYSQGKVKSITIVQVSAKDMMTMKSIPDLMSKGGFFVQNLEAVRMLQQHLQDTLNNRLCKGKNVNIDTGIEATPAKRQIEKVNTVDNIKRVKKTQANVESDNKTKEKLARRLTL